MKRTLFLLLFSFLALASGQAKDYEIAGPQGGISFTIKLPDDFHPETDRCPMVILMHGIFFQQGLPSDASHRERSGQGRHRLDPI